MRLYTYITDSTIALCWCDNTNKSLRSYVLSRVESARRMIQWTLDSEDIPLYHIEGTSNLAYLLTKPMELDVSNVNIGSDWQDGIAMDQGKHRAHACDKV